MRGGRLRTSLERSERVGSRCMGLVSTRIRARRARAHILQWSVVRITMNGGTGA